jgi:DNA ligase 1
MESFIIDSEIVAVNPADESLRSFQELSSRARKDVMLHAVKIPVAVFVFDLMYLDGKVHSRSKCILASSEHAA